MVEKLVPRPIFM